MPMRYSKWLIKLALVLICAAVLLEPGDSSWGDDGFYVIGVGSPWKRNGTNIYYTAGNVGIGTDNPIYRFHIVTDSSFPMYATSTASGVSVISAISTAASGPGWGVFGRSHSTDSQNAYGVYGLASGQGSGVKGENASTAGYGVYGENAAAGGTGICGVSSAASGNGVGVWGAADSTDGSAAGVVGFSPSGVGVRGVSRDSNGVVGWSTYSYAIYAIGDIGASGNKTAIVATSQGHRKLYAQESPEVWFEDFGEGQLKGGIAYIDLDPLFLETVTINDQQPLKVFIQLNDDCNGVYVQRQATGFEVKELRAGTSSARFTYRVVAKRKGYETARLEASPEPMKVVDLKTSQN